MKPLAWLALVLSFTSCMPGPKVIRRTPEGPSVPAAWHASLPEKTRSGDLTLWWRQLNDPLLSELVEKALKASPTIDLARARLRQARAERNLAVSNFFPTINAEASAGRSKNGDNAAMTNYRAGFDAGWEPDVFGGKRRALQAADAALESSVADFQDTQVSLSAEVALNYIDVRSFQARIAIAEENLTILSETRQIADWRYKAGLVSGLDVDQAIANESQTRAQIPSLQTSLAEARNRLAVLLGVAPGTLDGRLESNVPIPSLPESVTTAIPADILRRRPDVRAAERTFAAQTAKVGEAVAELYPSLNLSGTLGVEGVTLAALTGGSSVVSSLAASIVKTIFDGGRIRQRIRIQNAVQEQALATYESTLLTALEDVENALVSLKRNRERHAFLKTADEAARSSARLARQRYAGGLSDYLSVLETQRTQLTVSDSLKSCEADITMALIQLYKAFGGGWTADAASGPAPDQGKIP